MILALILAFNFSCYSSEVIKTWWLDVFKENIEDVEKKEVEFNLVL